MRPKSGGHQPAHRAHVLAVGERRLQRLLQPVHVHAARHQDRAVAPPRVMGSASTSYSSLISPTISSTMSSTETRPAVPPYSSMTTAKVMRRGLELLQQLRDLLRLRHQEDGRAPAAAAGRRARPRTRRRSRTVTTPTMSSRFSPKTGMRLYLVSRMTRRRSRHAWPAAGMATMSGRGVITSRTRVSAKRATASTRRPSSSSCTGGGRHLGRGGVPRSPPRARGSAAPPACAARPPAGAARARRVEDGQQHEQRALGVAAHQRVGHAQAEEQQVDDHDHEGHQQRPACCTRSGSSEVMHDGHGHVGGVGAHVHGHEQRGRVLEVAVHRAPRAGSAGRGGPAAGA